MTGHRFRWPVYQTNTRRYTHRLSSPDDSNKDYPIIHSFANGSAHFFPLFQGFTRFHGQDSPKRQTTHYQEDEPFSQVSNFPQIASQKRSNFRPEEPMKLAIRN